MRALCKIAAALLAAGMLLCSCGEEAEPESSQVSVPESSAEESSQLEPRAIPAGETAVETYGIVLSVSSGSVTVDLASYSGEDGEEADAGALLATGVEKTVNVDDDCPVLDADGNPVSLGDIPIGAAVRFTQTPSLLISIELLPEASAKTKQAIESSSEETGSSEAE